MYVSAGGLLPKISKFQYQLYNIFLHAFENNCNTCTTDIINVLSSLWKTVYERTDKSGHSLKPARMKHVDNWKAACINKYCIYFLLSCFNSVYFFAVNFTCILTYHFL